MKVYETGNIRNIVVMGHGGCGKTTLVEAIAYQTGITARMGKVTDGNTISDYDKEEQKRQFSIRRRSRGGLPRSRCRCYRDQRQIWRRGWYIKGMGAL